MWVLANIAFSLETPKGDTVVDMLDDEAIGRRRGGTWSPRVSTTTAPTTPLSAAEVA